MKKIAILGCGWLGLPVAKKIITLGYTVNGSTTRREKIKILQDNGIQPFIIKLSDQLECENPDVFFDVDIVLLNIPPGRRNPNVKEIFPKRVKMVLDAVKKNNATRLMFISSTGVYGNNNKIITENDIPVPKTDSGYAMLEAEQILLDERGNLWESNPSRVQGVGGQDFPLSLKLSILRLGGLVGGERKAGRFLAGKQNLSGGNVPVNMLHREDAVAIITQLIQQDYWGEIFNLCADAHPSKKEFYTTQAIKQGFEPPSFLEKDKTDFKIISNEKIKAKLNYKFLFPNPMQW